VRLLRAAAARHLWKAWLSNIGRHNRGSRTLCTEAAPLSNPRRQEFVLTFCWPPPRASQVRYTVHTTRAAATTANVLTRRRGSKRTIAIANLVQTASALYRNLCTGVALKPAPLIGHGSNRASTGLPATRAARLPPSQSTLLGGLLSTTLSASAPTSTTIESLQCSSSAWIPATASPPTTSSAADRRSVPAASPIPDRCTIAPQHPAPHQ
jgi:hypothetical protein